MLGIETLAKQLLKMIFQEALYGLSRYIDGKLNNKSVPPK